MIDFAVKDNYFSSKLQYLFNCKWKFFGTYNAQFEVITRSNLSQQVSGSTIG